MGMREILNAYDKIDDLRLTLSLIKIPKTYLGEFVEVKMAIKMMEKYDEFEKMFYEMVDEYIENNKTYWKRILDDGETFRKVINETNKKIRMFGKYTILDTGDEIYVAEKFDDYTTLYYRVREDE